MTYYVFFNFKKLILHEDDKQFNEYKPLDLDQLGIVNYNDTSQFIFFTMSKQFDNWAAVYLKDAETYLDISFQ